jgi:threonine dehydratase
MVSRSDVQKAQERIAGRVRRTPLMRPSDRDAVWLKCEFLQHCGVFKTRGAFNRQLVGLATGEIGDAGIVVASGGNAGLAQAFSARDLGIRATVFVPQTAPDVKVERIQAYGAEVRRVGSEYAEAYQAAVAFGEKTGAAFAHAYDQSRSRQGRAPSQRRSWKTNHPSTP